MGAGGIDAVLPLTIRDYERFEILRTSLRRFFTDLGTCWVVTPDKECDRIRSLIVENPYRVIPESTVIPELRFYNLVRERWGKRHAPLDGWYVQQLVKMAIADLIESPFYLTLDADVICTRRVHSSDLILDGRAVSHRYKDKGEIHRQWYLWAERVLRVRKSGWFHEVTPALLSKEAMIRLQEYLSRRVNPSIRLVAMPLPDPMKALLGSWRSFLLRNLPWTEYSLYNTYLEAVGLYDTYHIGRSGYVLSGNSVWDEHGLRSWEPEKSFDGNASFFFSVIQSTLSVTAAEVWEKVRPFLEGP